MADDAEGVIALERLARVAGAISPMPGSDGVARDG